MRRHQRLDEPEPVEPRRELVFRDLSRSRSGAALPRRSRSRRVVPLSRRSWRRGNRGRRRREQRKRRPRGTRRRTRPSSSPNGLLRPLPPHGEPLQPCLCRLSSPHHLPFNIPDAN
ncbi:unnamed protein product [Musa banksii]